MKRILMPFLVIAMVMLSSCSGGKTDTQAQNLTKSFIAKVYTVDAASLEKYKNPDENNIEQIYSPFKSYMTDDGFKEFVNNRTYDQNVIGAEKDNAAKSVAKIVLKEESGNKSAYQIYYDVTVSSVPADTDKQTEDTSSGIVNLALMNGKWKISSFRINR